MYETLSTNKREIRLLEISSISDGEVVCSLKTYSLQDSLEFAALSYIWGDSTNLGSIILNGKTVLITKNLALALRHVKKHWQAAFPRRDQESFRLWVDALCINQEDDIERGSQVQLMGQIYKRAEVVLSWLGDDVGEMIALSMNTIELLDGATRDLSSDDISRLEWMREHPSLLALDSEGDVEDGLLKNKRWSAVWRLFYHPYWRRVWIFQEFVLATNALLICPTRYLADETLIRVSKMLSGLRESLVQNSNGRPQFISEPAWRAITSHVYLSIISIIPDVRNICRDSEQQPADNSPHWEISVMTKDFSATDSRDHIYGMLSLSNIGIQPDYSKTLGKVYEDYISAWLLWVQASGSNLLSTETFFLDFAGSKFNDESHDDIGLPSWVPRYHEDPSNERYPWPGILQASKGMDQQKPTCISDSCLWVDGSQFACIREVKGEPNVRAIMDGSILKSIQDFVQRFPIYPPTRVPILRAVYLILVGRNVQEITRLDILSALSFLHILVGCGVHHGSTMEEILSSLGLASDEDEFPSSFTNAFFPGYNLEDYDIGGDLFEVFIQGSDGPLGEFIDKVQVDLFRRANSWAFAEALSLSVSMPYLGMVPEGTAVGDIVCVLRGCRYPVVLRKVNDHWIHIGICFVLGVMNGEALQLLETGNSVIERFAIR